MDASNPSIQKVEAEISEVQSHLQLYNQFEISFDNQRPCLLYGTQAVWGREWSPTLTPLPVPGIQDTMPASCSGQVHLADHQGS